MQYATTYNGAYKKLLNSTKQNNLSKFKIY